MWLLSLRKIRYLVLSPHLSNEIARQDGLDSRSAKVKEPSSENPPTPQPTNEPTFLS